MRVPFLDRLKDATRRDFENFYKEQPYQHARYAQSQLLTLEKWVSCHGIAGILNFSQDASDIIADRTYASTSR